MNHLAKILHVLAVGLWFGMAVFFSFPVALSLFATFERISEARQRPAWFPRSELYATDPATWVPPPAGIDKPPFEMARDVEKEQGIRAAGAAVGPMFDGYFLLQGACAVLALGTALPWPRAEPGVRTHKLRIIVLILAFATVLAGWPLERYVSELRGPRNDKTDALLQSAQSIHESVYREAVAARRAFGIWDGISTSLNLGVIELVKLEVGVADRFHDTLRT